MKRSTPTIENTASETKILASTSLETVATSEILSEISESQKPNTEIAITIPNQTSPRPIAKFDPETFIRLRQINVALNNKITGDLDRQFLHDAGRCAFCGSHYSNLLAHLESVSLAHDEHLLWGFTDVGIPTRREMQMRLVMENQTSCY